jgi:hypothetical protein
MGSSILESDGLNLENRGVVPPPLSADGEQRSPIVLTVAKG